MKAIAEKRIGSRKKHARAVRRKPADVKGKPVGVKKRILVNHSRKRVKSSGNLVRRDKNGHILPGSGSNGGGRPKGSLSGTKLSEIQVAITRVELERRKPVRKRKFIKWIDHQINKSYDDTTLASAILNKIHPTLKSIEQVTFAADAMDDQEAENIREELRERCKTLVANTERKAKG